MNTPAPAPADPPSAHDPHRPMRRIVAPPDSVPDLGFVDPRQIPTREQTFARHLAAAAPAVDAAPDWELRAMGDGPVPPAGPPAGPGRALRTESMGESLPAPFREWLVTHAQVAEAVHATVSLAQLNVACSDADGAAFDLASRTTIGLLERLLLGHAGARVRILVDDVQWLERGAARLRLLQRRFPHALLLRVADLDDPVGEEDRALIADDAHFVLLRPQAARFGERWAQHPLRATPLLAAFDRRWAHAAHDLPVQPLGL